jgi:hypothetical protein
MPPDNIQHTFINDEIIDHTRLPAGPTMHTLEVAAEIARDLQIMVTRTVMEEELRLGTTRMPAWLSKEELLTSAGYKFLSDTNAINTDTALCVGMLILHITSLFMFEPGDMLRRISFVMALYLVLHYGGKVIWVYESIRDIVVDHAPADHLSSTRDKSIQTLNNITTPSLLLIGFTVVVFVICLVDYQRYRYVWYIGMVVHFWMVFYIWSEEQWIRVQVLFPNFVYTNFKQSTNNIRLSELTYIMTHVLFIIWMINIGACICLVVVDAVLYMFNSRVEFLVFGV